MHDEGMYVGHICSLYDMLLHILQVDCIISISMLHCSNCKSYIRK